MSLCTTLRRRALAFCLLAPTATFLNADTVIADAADWGVYASLAGHAYTGEMDGDFWRITVEWKTPGQELVEHWINIDKPIITEKIRTITRSGPGQLHQAANIGCLNRSGRIQPDGSVLFICNSPLIKDPYVVAAPSSNVMEQRDVKLKDGAIAATTETVRLQRSSTTEEKRQFAESGGAPAAIWGVYANLAGTRWSGQYQGYEWKVSIDWEIVGQTMVERWEMAEGGVINAVTTVAPGTGKLHQATSRGDACKTRDGTIQPDGSVLFVCKSLIKKPTQLIAAPGQLIVRDVSLQNEAIVGIDKAWPLNELPGDTTQKTAQTSAPADDYQRGLRFDNGDGATADKAMAAAWYRRAADAGYAPAQHKLGNLYRDGLGLPQDDVQAMNWFRRAADQGNAEAQNSLGAMYSAGRGSAKDPLQAAQWYRRAAEQGLAAAQINLATLYESGSGVGQSDADAIAWYDKAAAQGAAPASDKAKQLRERIATSEQLATQKVAAERERIAALASGDSERQYQVGLRLQQGEGFPKDATNAAMLFRRAAESGHTAAQNALGMALLNGRGVAVDNAQALDWFRKAALNGNTDAQSNMGYLYDTGTGVPEDDAQAEAWYRKAANAGDATAQRNLDYLLASRESEAEYEDQPSGPSGAEIFANALNTFSQEYNNAMEQQRQQQAQIQQAYARVEQQRRRDEAWEMRRREAEARIAREEADATRAREAEYAQLQQTRQTEAQQTQAERQHDAEAAARQQQERDARAQTEQQRQQQAAERKAEQERAAEQQRKEQQRLAEQRRQEQEQKRLEEEARNRPVAYKEGVVLCEPREKPSTAWRCHGPLNTTSGVLDTPSGNTAIGDACGSDTYRDLGMVAGYRAYGCGFGIHPTNHTVNNRDVPADFGIDFVPKRRIYHCNPHKVFEYCRGQG